MSDELDIQIDRMTATISSMVSRLTQSVQQDVADIKAAYVRLADLFGSKDTGAAKLGTAVAKAEAPAAVPSGPVGVQLVKVINGSGEPVPVTVLKEERNTVGGALTTGLGAIGAFAGNFIGGIIGGASLPIVIGELITLVAEILVATPVIKQILTIADSAIGKVKDIIDKVPIILDLGIRVVLAYLEPVFNFAGAFVKAIATVIAGYLDWILAVANQLFARLPPYLNDLIAQLVRTAMRSALAYMKDLARAFVDTVASALIGAGLAIGNVVLAAGRYFVDGFLVVVGYLGRLLRDGATYLGDYITYAITNVLSQIPLLNVDAPSTKPTAPSFGAPSFAPLPDFGKELRDGFKQGADLGKSFAEKLFGPAPDNKNKQDGKAAPAGTPTLKLEPPARPVFEPPVFTAPRDSVLPDLLERTRAKPGERAPELPAPAPGVGKPAVPTAAAGPVAPVTFNGGITVHLNVARIDGSDAQATARAIAENLLQEVRRISEVERFRRGLATEAVG